MGKLSKTLKNVAQNLSAQSTVLLKNVGDLLPLQPNAKVAVIGLADANSTIYGGTGSGSVIPSFGLTPLDAFSAFAKAHGGSVSFTPIVAPGTAAGTEEEAAAWMAPAVAAAKDADVAVVFVGTTSGEGKDRESLGLGAVAACATCEQDLLVAAIAKAQPKTAVSIVSPVRCGGNTPLLCTTFVQHRSFCHDRLGTNTRKR
jgi:beta-glucosidase